MLQGNDRRLQIHAQQDPKRKLATVNGDASQVTPILPRPFEHKPSGTQATLTPPLSPVVSSTLDRDVPLMTVDERCASPSSPVSSQLPTTSTNSNAEPVLSQTLLLSPTSSADLARIADLTRADQETIPDASMLVSPRALARDTMSGFNSPPLTSLEQLTASLPMENTNVAEDGQDGTIEQGLSPSSHSDSSPEDDAHKATSKLSALLSTGSMPTAHSTSNLRKDDVVQRQANLRTSLNTARRRAQICRLRFQTFVTATNSLLQPMPPLRALQVVANPQLRTESGHAPHMRDAVDKSANAPSAATDSLGMDQGPDSAAERTPVSSLDGPSSAVQQGSRRPSTSSPRKRRSPSVSPDTVLHDAANVKRALTAMAARRSRVHDAKRRFDEAHAPFDPEATDESDVEDNMLKDEIAQRKGLGAIIYSEDLELHQAQVQRRRRRRQWLYERSDIHWRMRWLRQQADHVSKAAEAAAQSSSTSDSQGDTALPPLTHPAGCSRATYVPARTRPSLVDPAILQASNTLQRARSSRPPAPLVTAAGYRRRAAQIDPGFHPSLSRLNHAPVSVLTKVQQQAMAYYRARTEAMTLKSSQLKTSATTTPTASPHATSGPRRRKGSTVSRTPSSEVALRRPLRKSSHASCDSPLSVTSTRSTRRSSARSSADRRKPDLESVGLDTGFAPMHIDTSMLDRKDIETPSFRTLPTTSATSAPANQGPSATQEAASIAAPEDMSPEAFARRHDAQELRELAAWNTSKKGSTKALTIKPARPSIPQHFKSSEQYPKRRFPLTKEELAKLNASEGSDTVFSMASLPQDSPSKPNQGFKLVFKLKKSDA
eukprot:TRINITY_DN6715_c0_g1_i2.p1 TRINITY_DN6715_c0_g1~~TRINITY_DN6715_c0_g1_i2.p1  ORF type:complete len:830 (+),score=189.07 TRINITY_DN6715_c0_g1_i2:259-2748(+)